MSLDISLLPNKCPTCGRYDYEVFSANYTHNVTPMWSKAGVYEALYESDGKRAGDYIDALRKGVEDMKNNLAEYHKLDSPNGWGTANTAVAFLQSVLTAFLEHPDCTISVSR
jgi:hypothetical protein